MRKYQQLSLSIVSIFCFAAFLFYRHEYLELRSVLGVLNFFGSIPVSNSSCVLGADFKQGLSEKYNYLEPRSSWTKLESNFIYSSFWEDTADGGYVRTLAIGPISSFANYRCRVWFEDADTIVSKEGDFKYDLDIQPTAKRRKDTLRKYFLKCYVKNKPYRAVPYGVLLQTPSARNVFSPVFIKKKAPDRPVICVEPDYSGYSKTNIVEFMSFYNRIGIFDFIVYDTGVQHSLFPFLESITLRSNILTSFTVLPWNFPETDRKLESLSLKDDCLSRTFGISKLVGIVSWNEYLFVAENISTLRRNTATDNINLSFNTWMCCTNHPDDKLSLNSWPEFLRKTRCAQVAAEETVFVNLKSYIHSRKSKVYTMSSNVATKHRYDICSKLPTDSVTIPISANFTDVASHRLLQIWKSYLNTSAIFN